MALVPNWPFPIFFFFLLGYVGQENLFYDILEQKNAFLGYKNKKLKKAKPWDFSKGVSPCFSSKIGHFPMFFFRQSRQGKCVLWFSRSKTAFLRYKNKKLEKSKNWYFSNRVSPWLWSQIGHFSIFFFRIYRPGKSVLWYSRAKKNAFLGYKNKKLKKAKTWDFSKGVSPWFSSRIGHFSLFRFYRQSRPGKRVLWYSTSKKRLSML